MKRNSKNSSDAGKQKPDEKHVTEVNRKFLRRHEAAIYLNERGYPITKATLQKLATCGGGPPYQRFGTYALYTPPELDVWAEARLRTPLAVGAA